MESSYHRIEDLSRKGVGYQLESSGLLQCCGSVRCPPLECLPSSACINTCARCTFHFLITKFPPGGGGNKFDLPKNREEIGLNMGKENQKSSLFLNVLAYSSLFSCYLWPFQPVWRPNIQKFRRFAPRETRFHNFGHFSPPENREEISIFPSKGGGKNKGFWPKYLPL